MQQNNGQKLGALWGKVRTQAANVGQQAGTFVKDTQARGASSNGISGVMQGFSLPGEADKAAKILASFLGQYGWAVPLVIFGMFVIPADPSHPESALNAIPKAVLQRAKGLAVFTILKAGFVFSGKAGSGLVIARLEDGSWSAPSCIATAGLGWGLQIGADITEFVVVLNSDDAVRAFSMGGNVTVGGNISAAAGPIGTGGQIQASLAHPSPMFSYSRSKGLFAGISLEGTALVERKDANREFYGSAISARDILGGRVPAPEIASRMYDVIEAAEGIDESSLPAQGYVPTATGEHAPVPTQGYNVNVGATGLATDPEHKNKTVFESGVQH